VKPDAKEDKPVKVKKFDPYQYYKDEFKQSHPSMSEEELERVLFFKLGMS
jgi:hypothetical protein